MATIRRVLGHVTIEIAGAQRKCHRKPKDHHIPKSVKCLVIKDAGSGTKKNYCASCALEILEVAGADLQALRAELE